MESTSGLYRSADLCIKIRDLGYFCKITDVAQALRDTDVSSIFDHFFNDTVFVLWDKKSPVNGIAAEEIISTYGMSDKNEAFAVFADGTLVAFHITAPNGSGQLMTKKEALKYAEAAKNAYVINKTNVEILNTVCDKLIEKEIQHGKELQTSQ